MGGQVVMPIKKEEAFLIRLAQLPVIEENLRSVADDIDLRVKNACALVCTADTLKEVKRERAELNRVFRQLEDQRKEIKRDIMRPYDELEATYAACVGEKFRAADAALKSKIGDVENVLKDEKEKDVRRFFEELKAAKGVTWLPWSQGGIKITLSASLKSLKEQAEVYVEKAVEDIALIGLQPDDLQDEIYAEYRRSLSVGDAIQTVHRRRDEIEQQRKEREASAPVMAQMEKAAEKVAALLPPKEAPPEEMLELSFRVRGTAKTLKAMKEDLIAVFKKWEVEYE